MPSVGLSLGGMGRGSAAVGSVSLSRFACRSTCPLVDDYHDDGATERVVTELHRKPRCIPTPRQDFLVDWEIGSTFDYNRSQIAAY